MLMRPPHPIPIKFHIISHDSADFRTNAICIFRTLRPPIYPEARGNLPCLPPLSTALSGRGRCNNNTGVYVLVVIVTLVCEGVGVIVTLVCEG